MKKDKSIKYYQEKRKAYKKKKSHRFYKKLINLLLMITLSFLGGFMVAQGQKFEPYQNKPKQDSEEEVLEGKNTNLVVSPQEEVVESNPEKLDQDVKVIGIEKNSPEFRQKVADIATRLETQPIFLMAVMSFETAGTFSPSIPNFARSGATGLIQFMPETARNLGTSTESLAKMTALEQLDFVEKYFLPYKGRLNTLEDVYMAVLYPKAIGKADEYVLFKNPSINYRQNSGLDLNKDGLIRVGEVTK